TEPSRPALDDLEGCARVSGLNNASVSSSSLRSPPSPEMKMRASILLAKTAFAPAPTPVVRRESVTGAPDVLADLGRLPRGKEVSGQRGREPVSRGRGQHATLLVE